jgi:hypothetical protein
MENRLNKRQDFQERIERHQRKSEVVVMRRFRDSPDIEQRSSQWNGPLSKIPKKPKQVYSNVKIMFSFLD